jgi:CxxC motif-containing protein
MLHQPSLSRTLFVRRRTGNSKNRTDKNMKAQTPINMTCICCPLGCDLTINKSSAEFTIAGNKCPRGKKYAIEELTAPKRIVTSTVKIAGGAYPVIPVKTAQAIPKEKIFTIMRILANVEIQVPVHVGDTVVKNIADTGIDVVATCSCGRGVRAAEGA